MRSNWRAYSFGRIAEINGTVNGYLVVIRMEFHFGNGRRWRKPGETRESDCADLGAQPCYARTLYGARWMGDVEFKSRDLGNDRGCRVADATEFVASRSVRLSLNPHPHKT